METTPVSVPVKTAQFRVANPEADGEPEYHTLELERDTRPADIRRILGLSPEWRFRFDDTAEFLDEDTDLYQVVDKEHPKLTAVPDPVVGTSAEEVPSSEGIFSFSHLPSRLLDLFTRSKPAPAPIRVSHQALPRVTRYAKPLWQEEGWHETAAGMYTGTYKTSYGDFAGFIQRHPDRYVVGLTDCPPEVNFHPHRNCLFNRGTYWELHYNEQPTSVDAAIISVENFLTHSFLIAERRLAS